MIESSSAKECLSANRPSSGVTAGVVKNAYYSRDYLEREYARLWPRVWQMACRVEELAAVGDYVTYDIGNESVIILRSAPDRLQAFHNVCLHRGRRLLDGSGCVKSVACKFHGWSWDLDGNNRHVKEREDWCGALDNDDLRLGQVRFDTWGGFVFLTFDPDAEPLLDYLGEAAEVLTPFELDQMRFRWRKWLVMPANWKIALEAFNEGYHVAVTHHPLNRFGTSRFASRTAGKHATFGAAVSALRPESATRDVTVTNIDIRQSMAGFFRYLKKEIDSNMTDSMVYAAQLLPATVADGTPPSDVMAKLTELAIAIDAKRGVEWPKITPQQYQRAGIDWHIFPNMVLLPMATNCLGYRARPYGDDPDRCIFEVYQLERMPSGAARKVQNLRNDDIMDTAFWGEILLQDFQQMEATHRGIKSSGYKGPRLNPLQESAISNFHRCYHEYLNDCERP
jgi:phenylpropionate dioxygenase-like ring-hydroxylating dioxygenase large terminal subunit